MNDPSPTVVPPTQNEIASSALTLHEVIDAAQEFLEHDGSGEAKALLRRLSREALRTYNLSMRAIVTRTIV